MKLLILATLAALSPIISAQGNPEKITENQVSTEMTTAASTFLALLSDDEKKAATFDFKNEERENWHFVPLDRQGVRLDTLAIEKQHLAHAILSSGLSQKGYLTASQIMSLEAYLAAKENNTDMRNPGKYYLAIFGIPAATGTWAWRFEGHHLSINLTLVDGKLQDTPSFFGANPAEIMDGPRKGLRPLGEIEDAARALATEFQKAGQPVVFTEKSPQDVISGQDRSAKALAEDAVHCEKLNEGDRKKVLHLFDTIYALQRESIGANELGKLHNQDAKKITFAWAGSLERGQAHYFRLQSPDILIEYANSQNNANHAHLTLRNLHDDFGRDLLKEHYTHDHAE